MADKQVAIKSIIAAMNAMQGIQQQKTKLLTTMLEHSQTFRDNFLLQMAKNKMALQNKQDMMPLELEQKKQEKALPPSALEQSQISRNTEAANYYATGGRKGSPKAPTYADTFRSDFKNAVMAYKKIKTLPLASEEVTKRLDTVKARLMEAYPTESTKIRSYFDLASLDEEVNE